VTEQNSASESMTYTVELHEGDSFGPIGLDELKQWAKQRRVPASATIVGSDGSRAPAGQMEAIADSITSAVAAPPVVAGPIERSKAPPPDQGISTMIPYRNPPALIAYYLGLFSLLPLIGLVLAVPALLLGIVGLVKRSRQPEIKGAVHAWIGIIMGGLLTLAWGAVAIGLFMANW